MTPEWVSFETRDALETDCPQGAILLWHIYRGVVVETYEARRDTRMYTHWARLPDVGWIETEDRRPTADDADYRGCVLGWHRWDGFKIIGWRRYGQDKYLERWMRVPAGPIISRESGMEG